MNSAIVVGTVAAPYPHDKQHNLRLMADQMRMAAAQQVQLLVLPELALQGGLFGFNRGFDADEFAYHWQHAESIPGESTDHLCELARQHGMHLNFGMFEKVETASAGYLFNSSVFITPQGDVHVYRKIHQPIEEKIFYTPGKQWQVVDCALGKIGLMICYDQSFPEAARTLTLRGAQLLTVPSAWAFVDEQSTARYDLFGRARALENNRWWVQSNQVGKSDTSDLQYLGNSRIIDPDGNVVAATPTGEEGLAVATIELTTHHPTRANTRWYLRQRKPHLYGLITQSDEDLFDTPPQMG